MFKGLKRVEVTKWTYEYHMVQARSLCFYGLNNVKSCYIFLDCFNNVFGGYSETLKGEANVIFMKMEHNTTFEKFKEYTITKYGTPKPKKNKVIKFIKEVFKWLRCKKSSRS